MRAAAHSQIKTGEAKFIALPFLFTIFIVL